MRGQWIGRHVKKQKSKLPNLLYLFYTSEHILIFSSFVFLSLPWSNDEALNAWDTRHKIPLAPLKHSNSISICLGLVFDTFEAVFKALDMLEEGIKLLIHHFSILGTCLFEALDRWDILNDRRIDIEEDIANCNSQRILFDAWELIVMPWIGHHIYWSRGSTLWANSPDCALGNLHSRSRDDKEVRYLLLRLYKKSYTSPPAISPSTQHYQAFELLSPPLECRRPPTRGVRSQRMQRWSLHFHHGPTAHRQISPALLLQVSRLFSDASDNPKEQHPLRIISSRYRVLDWTQSS